MPTNHESQFKSVEKFAKRIYERGSFRQGVYWALLRNHSVTSKRTNQNTISENRDIADFEESMQELAGEIEAFADTEKNMHVRFYSDSAMKTLVGSRKIVIKKEESQTGLTGIGSGNSHFLGALVNANFSSIEQAKDLQRELAVDRLNRKIEDLEGELAYERDNKETFGEKLTNSIKGFAESPEGISQFLGTVKSVSDLIQMFKGGGAMAGLGAFPPTGQPKPSEPTLTNDEKQVIAIYNEMDEMYNGSTIQIFQLFLFLMKNDANKAIKILNSMQIDVEKIKKNAKS